MKVIKNILINFLLEHQIPFFYNKYLYEMARLYTNFYSGEANSNMATNGEYRFLNILFKKIDSGIVFDVGANKGDYTSYIHSSNNRIQLHCFEPSPEAWKKLKRLEIKGKIFVNRVALGSKEGYAYLHFTKGKSEHGSFYEIHDGQRRFSREKVKVTTLDNYCNSRKITKIYLLKIDTEGSEMEILKGAKKMIHKNSIDLIQWEYGFATMYSRTLLKDFFVLLDDKYEFYKIKRFGLEKITYSPYEERYSYVNLLCIRKKHPNYLKALTY